MKNTPLTDWWYSTEIRKTQLNLTIIASRGIWYDNYFNSVRIIAIYGISRRSGWNGCWGPNECGTWSWTRTTLWSTARCVGLNGLWALENRVGPITGQSSHWKIELGTGKSSWALEIKFGHLKIELGIGKSSWVSKLIWAEENLVGYWKIELARNEGTERSIYYGRQPFHQLCSGVFMTRRVFIGSILPPNHASDWSYTLRVLGYINQSTTKQVQNHGMYGWGNWVGRKMKHSIAACSSYNATHDMQYIYSLENRFGRKNEIYMLACAATSTQRS